MSEERKKSGAEKAIDRAELRAREKLIVALGGWLALREARFALNGGRNDECAEKGNALQAYLYLEAESRP